MWLEIIASVTLLVFLGIIISMALGITDYSDKLFHYAFGMTFVIVLLARD